MKKKYLVKGYKKIPCTIVIEATDEDDVKYQLNFIEVFRHVAWKDDPASAVVVIDEVAEIV